MSEATINAEVQSDQETRFRSRRLVGIAALISLIVCWGFVPVLLRDLAGSATSKGCIDAWTANGIRYPLAAVFYWPLLWWRRDRINRSLLLACLVPALLSTLGQVFWALAHYHLQASQIGFMVRASMLVSIIGAMILFPDERRLLKNKRFYVGLAFVICGFVALATGGGKMVVESDLTGLAIIAMCSLFFGCYIVSIRRFLPDADPILAFAIVAQFCSIGLIVGMLLKGKVGMIPQISAVDWGKIIASSMLGIAWGHMFMYASVQRLGAALTTSCQTATPFITVALAGVVLGERLSPTQWLAGIVIVLGALVLLSIRNRVAE